MRATPLRDLTEKAWDAQLFAREKGLASMLGWLSYHTLRSKGSQPGYPDRTLARDRIVFAELKAEGGRLSDRQRAWLDRLAAAGGEVYLWRPGDLDDVGRVLSKRWMFVPSGHGRPVLLDGFEMWTPPCLWTAPSDDRPGGRWEDVGPAP